MKGEFGMNRAIVFLGVCILLASIAIGGAWIITNKATNAAYLQNNRFYFGVSDSGIIRTVADKKSGQIMAEEAMDRSVLSGYPWEFVPSLNNTWGD